MASDVVSEAIKKHLQDNWTKTPIQFENEKKVPVADARGMPTPWVMVEYTGNLYGQQSIGASRQADNRWDEEGKLFIHVFAPAGTGGKTPRMYAKQLADLFRGTLLVNDTLEFRDASIGLGEAGDEKGNWFRISTEIDWRRMEA